MDGAALARRVRQMRPGLPIIYTSGRQSKIEHLEPVDGSMFVPKPYNPFDLGTAGGLSRLGAENSRTGPDMA